MIKVNLQFLKEKVAPDIFSKGISYFLNNKVTSLTFENYDSIENTYPHCNISSKVINLDNNIFSVEISIDSYNILNCSCSCNYSSLVHTNICEHSVATLLAYNDNYKKLLPTIKNTFNDINIFKDSSEANIKLTNKTFFANLKGSLYKSLDEDTKIPINIEPIINIDTMENEISMQLRVGLDKLYIVKNMNSFIESIKFGNLLELGRDFSFDPSIHCFNRNDLNVVQILLELHDRYEEYSFDYKSNLESNFLKGKKAILSESQLKKLLRLLKNRTFSLNLNGTPYTLSSIFQSSLPFTFFIENTEDIVKITQSETLPLPVTKDFNYFLYDGYMYRTDSKQKNIYKLIFNELTKNKEITLNHSQLDLLGDCIIPSLNTINATLILDESMKSLLTIEPLICTAYLDKPNDFITCKILFKYGSIVINPFSYSKYSTEDKVLVRDIKAETKIINILEKFDFTVQIGELCINNDDDLMEFIYKGLEELSPLCQVYYSDSFKDIKIYNNYKISSTLKINNDDLLEFSFKIDDIPYNEINDILSSIKLKKKYHRLKSGGFLYLDSPKLNNFFDTLSYIGVDKFDLDKDTLLLNKYNSIYLNQKLRDNELINIEEDLRFREIISSVASINDNDLIAPNYINDLLRDYQRIGFKWFKTLSHCGFGGILADEMGLGKTIQAISFINSLKEDLPNNPILVICPTSLVYNWENEINKFSPNLRSIIISGPRGLRENLIRTIIDFDVVITSYPLIRSDIEYYKNITFSCCLLDEAQHIKNPYSINSQSVKALKSKYRFALTGTPLENSLSELWSIFDFIMPGYLFSHNSFKNSFEIPIVKDNDVSLLKELNNRIRPFILRRTKKDVLKELPPKIEHKLIIDLNDSQKKIYASYINEYKNQIEENIANNNLSKNRFKILSLLTRLRQICCDPSIFIENYDGGSAKIETLHEIVEGCISQNHRVLIFSQFTSVLKNIKIRFDENNISSLYLDGSTPSEKRMDLVNNFNSELHDVFLISLKAGGTGLNLTSADTVIHFDPWWNPAVEDQATDRAHRIGQDKPVEVIKLITKGTIEDKITLLQERKKDIFSSIIDNSSDTNILTQMTEDDIRYLFNL